MPVFSWSSPSGLGWEAGAGRRRGGPQACCERRPPGEGVDLVTYVSRGRGLSGNRPQGVEAAPPVGMRGVARLWWARPTLTWAGGAWPGPARGGSGPARAGVRGHGGVGCGGKRCLKRVSKGRRGIAGDLAWQGLARRSQAPEGCRGTRGAWRRRGTPRLGGCGGVAGERQQPVGPGGGAREDDPSGGGGGSLACRGRKLWGTGTETGSETHLGGSSGPPDPGGIGGLNGARGAWCHPLFTEC